MLKTFSHELSIFSLEGTGVFFAIGHFVDLIFSGKRQISINFFRISRIYISLELVLLTLSSVYGREISKEDGC